MKKTIRRLIKKLLFFLGIDILLWNKLEYIKNKMRYRKILKKNIASIMEYKKKFDYGIFVETGTHRGNMINAMKNKFEKIYSIELGNDLYKMAKKRFEKYHHIKLLKGDSGIVLPNLLNEINEPAIFWLDAHYSQGETARGEIDTPIENELESVLNHKIKNHVIMIDDARCFNGKDGYPTTEAIRNMATEYGYLFEMKDDSFRLYPHK